MLRTGHVLTSVLMLIAAACGSAHCQALNQCSGVASFFLSMPGEWVGTVTQSTDGKLSETKFFRATTRQVTSDTYETAFSYYRSNAKTCEPVAAGTSCIATKIDALGTATNSITGKGDVLVDGTVLKPETHVLTEILNVCPSGGLQGTATGCVSVSGMPLNLGKNGKVRDYSSTWSMDGNVLKINQRFKVSFVVLMLRRNHSIVADYTATRGTDLAGLMRDTQNKAAGPPACL